MTKSKDLLVLLALGVAYSASLGGMVTILGAAANAVASGFLAKIGPWSFIDWMKYGLPAFIVIFPLTWWLPCRLIRLPIESLDVEPARKQVAEQGSISRKEIEIIGVLGFAAVPWVGGPFIEQLKKNPAAEIITADPRTEHYAVEPGVIEDVDLREALTPMNLDQVLDQLRPDLVPLAMQSEDMGLGEVPGVDILADAMHDELAAISKIPVIEVARSGR